MTTGSPTFDAYTVLERLYESPRTQVVRARERDDRQTVILKLLNSTYPPSEEAESFRREFELTSDLRIDGIIRVRALHPHGQSMFMVFDDIGGHSLTKLMAERRFSVRESLNVCIRVAALLGEIHRRGVIHKDINPNNIIYCPETDTLEIIDFGIATRLPRQSAAFVHPRALDGTPLYMSPEQTGRMNRYLDHRTDLYSLGATLYALLCGHPPFVTSDPMRLIHCHLAQEPTPPRELVPEIPSGLSDAVMKLLRKNAEDRYATAWCLERDLRMCLAALDDTSQGPSIIIDSTERSDELRIPQILYGRGRELEVLAEVFARAAHGRAELLLVSGYSGVGKTSLVQELHRPVTLARGTYVAGKFDQLRRSPYAALGQALTQLIRQLLVAEDAELGQWRTRLLRALGADAQVMLDFIPELQRVIGPQAPVEALGAVETNLRFRRVLANFLGVFCDPSHPLVMFIDDLQWADGLSLDLLGFIMREGELKGLLVVGAYRDNEMDAVHPLLTMVESLRTAGCPLHDLHINDLEQNHLQELLAATFNEAHERVAALAALIKRQTGGNPFFVRELLRTLHVEGMLRFEVLASSGGGRWTWEESKIEQLGHTDNVIDLMLASLRRLPARAVEILQRAATLGNRFDLETLAIIEEEPRAEIQAALRPAIDAGFVLPIDNLGWRFRFSHDRVQQAADELMDASQRRSLHGRVGRMLLERLTPSEREERHFEIVDHLNMGDSPDAADGRIELARLNLEAAQRAMRATAFEAAHEYIVAACDAFPEQLWPDQHDLAMEIFTLRVKLASITARHETAETFATRVLEHAKTNIERARIYLIQIDQRTILLQYNEALSLGLVALEGLGVTFPSEGPDALRADQEEIDAHLGGRGVASLIELPDCQSADASLAIVLATALMAVTHQARPSLMSVLASRVILLVMKNGLHPAATLGFAAHAIALIAAYGRYGTAYDFGKLALDIARRYHDRSQLCRATNVMITFVSHWSRPFEEDDELVRVGFQAGIESGERQYSSYVLSQHVVNQYVRGMRLPELAPRVISALDYVMKTKAEINRIELIGQALVIRNLLGQTRGPEEFVCDDPEIMDESPILAAADAGQMLYSVCQYEIDKGQLLYLYGSFAAAAKVLADASERLMFIAGCSKIVDYHLYRGLTYAARYAQADELQRVSWLSALDEHIEKLAEFARHYPGNSLHKLRLLQAERARITGQHWTAVERYDQAIASAAQNRFLQIEALSQWLAARFWLAHDKPHLAAGYLRRAHEGFRAWGAARVVEMMERDHPNLSARVLSQDDASGSWTGRTGEASLSHRLDLRTVVEAWRGVTTEHDLGRLLGRVMRASLENAGANRGVLFIAREGGVLAKARGTLGAEFVVEQISVELAHLDDVSTSIVRYVVRSGAHVVVDNAQQAGVFSDDPYLRQVGNGSVLCLPLLNQGTLIGVLYMENRKVTAAFSRERIDVLELLITPAAIAIENALLKHDRDATDFVYQVGGSLAVGAMSYVQRRADRELISAVTHGEFCYVLCPRQVGKSSLRVHTTHTLTQRGITCISVDLTLIGSQGIRAEQWYAGLARRILAGAELTAAVPLRTWWSAHDHLSPVQRLAELIDSEILTRIEGPLVIFLDEIDSMLSLGFAHDDFFAMLRGLYNLRADNPRYRRLSVVLLGVCSPAQLINDISRTPFNIGRHVRLDRFHATEARPLLGGLARIPAAQAVLDAVLSWTNGQPFLTQKVCNLLTELETEPLPGQESKWVGQVIFRRIIDNWDTQDEPIHLRAIRDRILRSPRGRIAMLRRYKEIYNHQGGLEKTSAEDGEIDVELLLSGLVLMDGDRMRVANRIYERVFGPEWIAASMALD